MEANTTPARAKGIDSLPEALLRHRVLSERDAAKFIGLSHSRLAAKRHAGATDIPKHVRISEGRVGYIVADILEWLDELGEANTGGEHHARAA